MADLIVIVGGLGGREAAWQAAERGLYDIRGLGAVIGHYGGEFQKSCDRHDFGYRNHGLSGVSRSAVDTRHPAG